MAKTGSIELHEACLTNIVGGDLERQFQDGLAAVAAIFAMPEEYQADKDGMVVAKIVIEIEVKRAVTGEETMAASADVKAPKRRRASQPVWYSGGTWNVSDPSPEQLSLLTRRPAPVDE